MITLSIIALLFGIAAIVLAIVLAKKNSDKEAIAGLEAKNKALETKVASIEAKLSKLEKQVAIKSLEQIIIPTVGASKEKSIITYDADKKTVTIAGNLSVTGWVTAGGKKED